jgi:hypothetical protein
MDFPVETIDNLSESPPARQKRGPRRIYDATQARRNA